MLCIDAKASSTIDLLITALRKNSDVNLILRRQGI